MPVPLYRYSFREAKDHDEIQDWKQSHAENIRCRDAIDKMVSERYSNNIIAYLEKSAKEKRKEIPVGLFNSKPAKNPRHAEQYCSVDGGHTYTDVKLRGANRARFRRKIELLLFDLPDSLYVTEICNITGYSPNTIKRYIRKKRLFAVMINGKYVVSKHMNRIFSSREIEKVCKTDIRFMWLLNGEPAPSDSMITRFMRGHLGEVIEDLFYQFVEKLYEMEEIKFKNLFVDGTKIKT